MTNQFMLFNNCCSMCGGREGGLISFRWAVIKNITMPLEKRGHVVWIYECPCGYVTEYTDNPTIVNVYEKKAGEQSV